MTSLVWVSKPEWAALFTHGRGVHDICSLRFTSGVTPGDLLMASMVTVADHPHASFSRGRIRIRTGDLPNNSLVHVALQFVNSKFG